MLTVIGLSPAHCSPAPNFFFGKRIGRLETAFNLCFTVHQSANDTVVERNRQMRYHCDEDEQNVQVSIFVFDGDHEQAERRYEHRNRLASV